MKYSVANETSNTTRGATRLTRGVLATAVTAVFGALSIASMGSPTAAHADTWLDEWHDYDGSHIEIWRNDQGQLYIWGVEADGENWVYTFDGNPNPDDPSSEDNGMTPEKLRELIKKYGHEMSEEEESFLDGLIGRSLTNKGDGIVPVHNPSDLAKTYDDGFEGTGGLGFDPNGGNIVDQMGKPKGEPDNPNQGGEDRDDYGTETPKYGMYEDDMPGPPEIINPNPVLVGDPFVGDPIGR